MSYQVLARKWRPKSFANLVGQDHVVRALTHALSTGRLHHAYLFTGTRGVGKTTISRIFAKALNCETGVTAEPCGQCGACMAIDADRFPDYLEMDAASNRGVDDMAALLDRAVYAPVEGRYKVYMIDEVHMLTGHAFNAMLKTLEEPPEHVKFILATTDPQKIPVTVLSRCLQFNLKQMSAPRIVEHLAGVLDKEGVPHEAAALSHIAKAADGSMRDALSLLDQAIAHGAGKIEASLVAAMLGTVGDDHLYGLLDALAAGEVEKMISIATDMETRSLSFEAALQSFASLLTRIALLQFAPGALTDETERVRLTPYVAAFDPEYLQLAYQIAIRGREEIGLAPDEYTGFTMTLLRLHAFRPVTPAPLDGSPSSGSGEESAKNMRPPSEVPMRPAPPPPADDREAVAPSTKSLPYEKPFGPASDNDRQVEPPGVAEPAATSSGFDSALAGGDWPSLLRMLDVSGLARELGQHCEWLSCSGDELKLRLSITHRHLLEVNPAVVSRLQERLSEMAGRPMRLRIEVGTIENETPAQRDQAEKARRHAEAVAHLESDPFVLELIEQMDATLIESSVKPLQPL